MQTLPEAPLGAMRDLRLKCPACGGTAFTVRQGDYYDDSSIACDSCPWRWNLQSDSLPTGVHEEVASGQKASR